MTDISLFARTIRGQARRTAIASQLIGIADALAAEEELPRNAIIDQLARLAVISVRVDPGDADLDFEFFDPLDDEQETLRKARLFLDSQQVGWVDRAVMLIDRADRPNPVTAPEGPTDPN